MTLGTPEADAVLARLTDFDDGRSFAMVVDRKAGNPSDSSTNRINSHWEDGPLFVAVGVVSGAVNVEVDQGDDGTNDTFTFAGGTVGISESVYQSGEDPDTIRCDYLGSITVTLIRAQ